jgi:zinc transport system substrate-binding protein
MRKYSSFITLLLAMLCLNCYGAPQVAVTIKPIHALVAGIMQGVGEPQLLLPDGTSPHTFQLKPSTLKQLQQAELIIWVGPELELFMVKSLEQFHPRFGVLTLLALDHLQILNQRNTREWAHDHKHDHDESSHHSHEGQDPHIWLSTDNAKIIVDSIAAVLSQHDPDNAKIYQANAKNLKAKINTVKTRLTAQLSPVQTKPFMVYHDGYQYFEKEFQLDAVGTMMINPHLPLSAHGLSEIKQLIKDNNVKCVFRETEFNDTMTRQYLNGIGVNVEELDPLGARIPQGPQAYEKILLQLGDTLSSCLQK